MADLLTEPAPLDEDTALLDRANNALLGRARNALRARPAPPTVPPARVEPNPAATVAGARALLGGPLPPLQGFTFGRLPSFSEAASMFTDQFSHQLLSGSRALPPDPAGLAIHSALPADVIEKFPDSFRSDINQLYQDRGLELPDVKPGDTERFHRWERGYLGHLEQVDAPTHEALKDAVFKGDTAFISNWQKGMRILHLAQTAPASARDRSAAIARAWWDYQRADIRMDPGTGDPQDEEALTNRPYQAPPPPREKIPASAVESLLNKQLAKIPLAALTEAEQALAQKTQGFADFALPRLQYYTSINRVEQLTGTPARTPDPIIFYRQTDTPKDWLSYFTTQKAGTELADSSVPEKSDFSHLDIAPAVPFFQDLIQKSAQITQSQKEARAKAALERAFSLGLPGGQGGGLATLADPEAAAAAQAFTKQRESGAPMDLAKLGADLEKVQKENPYLDPKERYKFFKSAGTTGLVLAPIAVPLALGFGMEGAITGALAMGAYEALSSSANYAGRGVSKLLTGDPGGWDAYIRAVPSYLYKGLVSTFSPESTDKLAKYDSFWRDSLPVSSHIYDQLDSNSRLRISNYTEALLRRITDPSSRSSLAAGARALGLGNPYLQTYAGDFMEENLVPLVVGALGMSALFRMAHGFQALPSLRTPWGAPKDPMLRFTPEELLQASEKGFSPLSPAMRSPLLQVITQEMQKLPDAEAARGLLSRLVKETDARGPLDPALTASAMQSIADTKAALDSLSGTDLSTQAKLTLARLPPVLAELGPTEGWYAATGKVLSLGKAESTRTAELLKTYLDRLELNSEASVPGWVEERFGRNLPEVIDGLRAEQQRKTDFIARRDTIVSTLSPLLEVTQKEAQFGKLDLADYVKHKASAIQEWNQLHLQAAAKLEALASGTPLELPRPNRAAFTRSFNQVFEASADGKLTPLFQKSPELFAQVYGELAPKYRAAAKRGTIPEADLVIVADEWLNDNLRPDRQTFASLDELKKARGFTADPRSFSPASLTPEHISQKITKALADGEPISLGDKQHEFLNLAREVPLNPKKAQGRLTNLFNSIDGTAKQKSARLEETKKFATELEKFIQQVSENPDQPRKFRLSPRLLSIIEQRLKEPSWIISDFERNSISWVPELSLDQRSGLGAFQEATASLPPEIEELRKGYRRYGSLEQAAASISNPGAVPYLIRQQATTSAGLEGWFRFRWDNTKKLLDKRLSPADYQKLQVEMSSDTIPAGDEAARLWQDHQHTMLEHSYLSGLLSESKYQEFLHNKSYFHSFIEDEPPSGVPKNALPTSRFAELKTDPNPFKFKLPHDSWYLEYELEGKPQHKAGFKDQGAAERGLVELSPSLPLGTKVAIRSPYTLSAREVAGEVVDAGAAGYHLTEQLGLNIAHAYMNRSLANSKFVMDEAHATRVRPPDALPGTHFIDPKTKLTWYYVAPEIRARWLEGKYVDERAIDMLKSTSARYGWLQRMADELQQKTGFFDTVSRPWKNPLFTFPDALVKSLLGVKGIGPALSVVGHAGLALNRIFALSRIGVSTSTLPKQASSNLVYNMPLMGLNPMTPHGSLYTAKYFSQYLESLRDPATALDDFVLNSLVKNNNVEYSRLAFNQKAADNLKANWNSLKGLEERLARAKAAEADIYLRGLPEETARKQAAENYLHLKELEAEITKQTDHGRTLMAQVGEIARDSGRELLGTVADLAVGKGGGKFSQGIADWVGFSDNAAKYAAHAFNLEVRGMSEHNSLSYIDAYGQNLQRTPEAVRSFSQTPLATRFASYPYNFYQTAGNALLYRSGYVTQMLGSLAAYNFTTFFLRGEDPREYFEHYARINNYGRSTAFSQAAALLTTLQLPNGGALDLNSIWGPFQGQSPVARRVDTFLTKNAPDPYTGVAMKAFANVASKFVGSNPLLSLYTQLASGEDQQKRPITTWPEWFRGLGEVILPDWMPGSGREWEEVVNATTTSYKSPYTGEQKSFVDFALKRLISYIPPSESNSPARFRAATDAYLFQQPARFQNTLSQMFDDGLERTLWAAGAFHDDDTLNVEKARPLIQAWYADPRHVHALVLPDGSLMFDKQTPKEIEAKIFELSSHPTTQLRSLARQPFNVQLDLYALWRQTDSHPDPAFHAEVVRTIAQKVLNSHPEVTHLAMDEIPFTRALLESPDLPPDAKSLLQGWLATAVQHAIKSEMDRAGKAPPVR